MKGIIATLVVSGLMLGGATPALGRTANAATSVTANGGCSGPSTWLLTLKPDGARIEADLEVQTPRAGQTWHSRFTDNGVGFGSGGKTTLADGSFSITRYTPRTPRAQT